MPKQTIDIYADEKIYAFQKIDGKSIGVDTARYYLSIDGRDGYNQDRARMAGWGSFEEYYRENGKGPHFQTPLSLTVAIPEEQDFNWMKQMAGYFFEDMQPVTPKKQKKMDEPSR